MKKLLLIILLLAGTLQAYAQSLGVYGSVRGTTDTTALPGATVILENTSSAAVSTTITDQHGKFRFERVTPGQYSVKINYLGFKPFSRPVQVQQRSVNLGSLALIEDAKTIKEVEVIGRVPLGEQKGDTTQFNAAAFKTAPDASAEDLVQKLPGVTIQDGKIQAQGEDVKQVLVDGKRFFEGDAETALRNLPAEIIDNIQIFDKKSDQAEFSGFDDGNRAKTINIVTKPNRRQGQFGKASAGYGTDERYMVGASVNLFKGNRRLTVSGITNNINMSDYSVGETPGGGMRGRRGGGGGGGGNAQSGITNTNNLNLNFSDNWGKKVEVSGNYSYSRRDFNEIQSVFQRYVSQRDSGQVYTEHSRRNNLADNHRFNMRLDYKINETNRLLITPGISGQQSEGFYYRNGLTANGKDILNETENTNDSKNNGYSIFNNIFFNHRFSKIGRTFSTSLNTSYNTNNGNNFRLQDNYFYTKENPHEVVDQYISQDNKGYSWQGNVSYTEPVGDSARLQLQYKIGKRVNDSDKRTFDRTYLEPSDSYDYSELNTGLSNTFVSDYLTQELGAGYQYNTKKLRLDVGAEYQKADLQNNQDFPLDYSMSRTFYSLLPSTQIEYRFSKTRNLRIDYRTNTDAPSVGQLQDVIDNSNPLLLRTGNPNLKQSYQNRINLRFRNFNPETNQVFFIGLFGTITNNNITNSTFTADTTLILPGGIEMNKGSRLIRPINIDGNWDVRSFFNYGQPVNFISSNINLNGSIGYSRRPGLINNNLNYANNTNFRFGVSISSNISEKIDFNISTNSSYNVVTNTLLTDQNNNYFNQSTNLRYNWIFLKNLVYRTELSHQLNSGLSAGYDNSYLLWNMSISKKVFKNQKGEVSLSVNDLLKQNVSIRRNVTDFYIEDVQTNVLQRYFMLTFSYNIRNFTGGSTPRGEGVPGERNMNRGEWGGRNRN